MRAVIFANGDFSNHKLDSKDIRTDDLLIAADGGGRHCLALGLSPAYVIGDFDSLSDEEQAQLEASGAELIRHPSRKNETDLELALLQAKSLGAKEVIVYGGLGARWDQSLANVLLVSHPNLAALDITFIDSNTRIHSIHHQLRITGKPGDIVSLIPITEQVEGIQTINLEYPLSDEVLYLGSTRGVSNVLTEKEATISIRTGILLCVVETQV